MTATATPTVPTTPIEVVTPIKPSEAIRLGCLTTTQAFEVSDDGGGGRCALGAMALGFGDGAVGWDRMTLASAAIDAMDCPVPGCGVAALSTIVHLNDEHRWTRERIADWAESIGL